MEGSNNDYDDGNPSDSYASGLVIGIYPIAGPNASTLTPGGCLFDNRLTSPDGNHYLSYQGDGNLVIYNISTGAAIPTWATNTSGTSQGRVVFQADGNLCVYDNESNLVWQNNKAGTQNPAKLVMQDDGNLVAYQTDGTDYWNTQTSGQ